MANAFHKKLGGSTPANKVIEYAICNVAGFKIADVVEGEELPYNDAKKAASELAKEGILVSHSKTYSWNFDNPKAKKLWGLYHKTAIKELEKIEKDNKK